MTRQLTDLERAIRGMGDDERAGRVEDEAELLRIRNEARRLVDAEERPDPAWPEVLTLRERLERPQDPVAWRIEGWQPAGARVVLAAQYKAGKTTLTGNLTRSLVDGTPFLGRDTVSPMTGTVAVFDFEMSSRQLDTWLREQGIVNGDRVVVLPMRGSASAFNLLDPGTRSQWAELLVDRGVGYLIWDCLRPVMDALGLDENHDAGRLLTAFDALLAESGIGEAAIVHHMGHSGERSRGDSRLRDWPDVEWRLVRESEDETSPRYLSAFGRDVDMPESKLAYDPQTRRLTLAGGNRGQVATSAALTDVLALLEDGPLSQSVIEKRLGEAAEHKRAAVREALRNGVASNWIRVETGDRGARIHSLNTPHVVSSPTSPDLASKLPTTSPATVGSGEVGRVSGFNPVRQGGSGELTGPLSTNMSAETSAVLADILSRNRQAQATSDSG